MKNSPSHARLCFCTLALTLLCGLGAAQDRTVSRGFDAGLAFLDSAVLRIAITNNIDLDEFGSVLRALTSNGARPFTISRDLLLYGPSGGQVTLDFAFLSGLAKIQPGVTVTFRNLQLRRLAGNLPSAIFRNSPGATVRVENCGIHLLACAPTEFSRAYYREGDVGFEQGSSTINIRSNQIMAPVFGDLGGYNIVYSNTRITCGQQIPFSQIQDACPEIKSNPGQGPTQQCFAASVGAIFRAQCGMQECINYCRANCK